MIWRRRRWWWWSQNNSTHWIYRLQYNITSTARWWLIYCLHSRVPTLCIRLACMSLWTLVFGFCLKLFLYLWMIIPHFIRVFCCGGMLCLKQSTTRKWNKSW